MHDHQPARSGALFAGKYELLSPIGRGGMAQVWLAHKESLGGVKKACAIKMPTDLIGTSALQRTAILNEARIASQLTHSNIVQVFDIGEHGGIVYLELERIDGLDLAQLLSDLRQSGEQLSIGMAVYIVGCVLEGLRYAHEFAIDGRCLGIMHRDLTPSNVIVSSAGEVKIMDFGIGKTLFDETSHQHIKGKIRYMSPEQARGESSTQCDLFAIGALFYELVEGRKFRSDVVGDLRIAVAGGAVPRLTRADVPAPLVAFFELCTAAKRSDRFTSSAEAISRLGEWRGARATAADLRALYATQVGERPHSGFTFGDFEIPAPLRAILAVMDEVAASHRGGGAAIEADAPVVVRRGSPTPRAGHRPAMPSSTQPLGQREGVPPRTPPTEHLRAQDARGASPPSSTARVDPRLADLSTRTAAPVSNPGRVSHASRSSLRALGWRGVAVIVGIAVLAMVVTMIVSRWPPQTASISAAPTPAIGPSETPPTPSIVPAATVVAEAAPIVAAAPPATVVQPPALPATASVQPAAALAASPAKKKVTPAPRVTVRIVEMLAEGELAIDKNVYAIGGGAHEVRLAAGKHTVWWRAKGTSEWVSRPKLVLVAGRKHLLRVSKTGVQHIILEDP